MATVKIYKEFEVFDKLIETTNTSLKVLVKNLKIEDIDENGLFITGEVAGKKMFKHITMNILKLLLVSNQIL